MNIYAHSRDFMIFRTLVDMFFFTNYRNDSIPPKKDRNMKWSPTVGIFRAFFFCCAFVFYVTWGIWLLDILHDLVTYPSREENKPGVLRKAVTTVLARVVILGGIVVVTYVFVLPLI